MDTLAGLAFAGEPPLAEYMREKPKRRDETIINRYMYSQIAFTGGFSVVMCVVFLKSRFSQIAFNFHANSDYFITAFFALFIFAAIFNCFNARTNRLNLLANILHNPAFIFIMILIGVVQIVMIYMGGSVFRTTGLSTTDLWRVIMIASTVIPVDLTRKVILRLYGRIGTI